MNNSSPCYIPVFYVPAEITQSEGVFCKGGGIKQYVSCADNSEMAEKKWLKMASEAISLAFPHPSSSFSSKNASVLYYSSLPPLL